MLVLPRIVTNDGAAKFDKPPLNGTFCISNSDYCSAEPQSLVCTIAAASESEEFVTRLTHRASNYDHGAVIIEIGNFVGGGFRLPMAGSTADRSIVIDPFVAQKGVACRSILVGRFFRQLRELLNLLYN